MKVISIMKESPILRKVSNRIATYALGTTLLLSTASVKAQDTTKKLFPRMETPEMIASTAETDEAASDKTLLGGFLLGSVIAAYIGCCALGNHLHDKKR